MLMPRPLRTTTVSRRLRSALLVAGVSAVMLLATAGTASAEPAATTSQRGGGIAATCPFSSLCLYDETDFNGERFTVSSLDPNGTCVSLVDHGWGDRAHSAINTHNNSAAMFMNDDCLGGPYRVPGDSQLPSFGAFTPRSVWVPAS